MSQHSNIIEDLKNPQALPDPTSSVSVVQTHISIVLIGDAFVYKVKKPVNFGFLDFSTLDKRRYYCDQEVRLNQRLSEGVYLEVLPVLYDGRTHRVGGDRGEAVEYAVRMRRIPEERLMKSLFARGELREQDIEEIAGVLANFHQRAECSADIDAYGEPDKVRFSTDENFEQTERYLSRTIDPETYERIRLWTADFYARKEGLFRERIAAGRIRDCHGDLHMEHVCLMQPLCILDCIEFNERFRYTDVLADVAFLLMDLEYNGGVDLAERLWAHYTRGTGEEGMEELLTFYKVYRAYVRGKVNSFQLDDDQIGAREKGEAAQRARRYFQLALSYLKGR
ncbi:MAG: phosphotransferase [Deltaproteobacteria bacterium]|nr:phosphotransferase [Deltaproteobacteria bacterium]